MLNTPQAHVIYRPIRLAKNDGPSPMLPITRTAEELQATRETRDAVERKNDRVRQAIKLSWSVLSVTIVVPLPNLVPY